MALSKSQNAILWAGVASKVVSTNSQTASSDAYVLDSTCVAATVHLSSTCSGTPASGDYVDWYIQYETGSALGVGAASNAYDTVEHAQYLGRTDNFATNTPGETSAQITRAINVAPRGFKIYAIFSATLGTSGRTQTIYTSCSEQRAA